MKTDIIGCFGGTFDPPHLGHINLLEFVSSQLGCKPIKLLPCHIPAHKSPETSAEHRVNMCMLMQDEFDFIDVDLREIQSNNVSYTAKTLAELRHESPDAKISFIIGMDSFMTFTSWFEWETLFNLANIIVVGRQSDTQTCSIAADVAQPWTSENIRVLKVATKRLKIVSTSETEGVASANNSMSTEKVDITPVSIDQCRQILDNTRNGCLVFMNNPLFNVSSTEVRKRLRAGESTTEYLLPSIAAYISEHGLYPSSKGEN